MKLPRRTFLHLTAGAAALPAVSRIAVAQSYPSRAVRMGTPAITITLPIQKPGAPRHLVEDEVRALGDAGQAPARLVHLGARRLHPFVKNGERARIAIDRHTECFRHAAGGDVAVRWPDPAGGEDIGVAMPERVECIDDRDTTHNSCDQNGRSPSHGWKNAVTLYGGSHGADDFDTFCR